MNLAIAHEITAKPTMTTPNHLHKTTVPRLCPFSPLCPSI